MKGFFNRFKIPTVLGLGIITLGIATGVILNLNEQNIISKAYPSVRVQNLTLTNVSDDSVTISWQTTSPVAAFINFGITSLNEYTILEKPHTLHYVTIKNLLPKTTYQYKIVTGKTSTDTFKFSTAIPLNTQIGLQPVIGSVLDGDKPLNEGLVYLSIYGATTQSSLIKTSGNFLIPTSQIRKSDLSEFPLTEDIVTKLSIISTQGEASALFRLGSFDKGLPPIRLGENLDLTSEDLPVYDLNGDGKINAADNAIILQNFGNSQNSQADLNGDEIVDQKDLDLMAKQINQ